MSNADTAGVIAKSALETAAALAPQLAAANPTVAAIVALAPIAVQMLDAATKLNQAGALQNEQLASLFASIGQGIQSTHDEWARMNAAEAAAGK